MALDAADLADLDGGVDARNVVAGGGDHDLDAGARVGGAADDLFLALGGQHVADPELVGVGVFLGGQNLAHGEGGETLGGVVDALDLEAEIGQGEGDLAECRVGLQMLLEPGEREFHEAVPDDPERGLGDRARLGKGVGRGEKRYRGVPAANRLSEIAPCTNPPDLEDQMTIHGSPFPDIAIVDQSITERVFAGLIDRPDEVVLIDGSTGRGLTAAAFMDQVRRLAGGLTAAGYGAGGTVGLMAPNSPEYCVVFHGVAWAGGTITTLNPSYKAPRWPISWPTRTPTF